MNIHNHRQLQILRAGLSKEKRGNEQPHQHSVESFDLSKITRRFRNILLRKYIRKHLSHLIAEHFEGLDSVVVIKGKDYAEQERIEASIAKKLKKDVSTASAQDFNGIYGIDLNGDQNLRNKNVVILGDEYNGCTTFEQVGSLIGNLGGFAIGGVTILNSSNNPNPEIITINGIVPLKSIIFHPLNIAAQDQKT